MREECSRLREQKEQPLLSKSMPDMSPKKARRPVFKLIVKLHRARGMWVEVRRGGCQGQANATSASYSSVTMDNFLSFSFLICKILFTWQGVVRTESGPSSAVPTSSIHSLSANYHH